MSPDQLQALVATQLDAARHPVHLVGLRRLGRPASALQPWPDHLHLVSPTCWLHCEAHLGRESAHLWVDSGVWRFRRAQPGETAGIFVQAQPVTVRSTRTSPGDLGELTGWHDVTLSDRPGRLTLQVPRESYKLLHLALSQQLRAYGLDYVPLVLVDLPDA